MTTQLILVILVTICTPITGKQNIHEQQHGYEHNHQHEQLNTYLNHQSNNNTQTERILNERSLEDNLKVKETQPLISDSKQSKCPFPKVIWMYWSSGKDSVPIFPKLCYERIQKMAKGWKVNFLSQDSLKDYINMTLFQNTIKNKKIWYPALVADLIRIMVLAQYGGVWFDATTVLVQDLNWLQNIIEEKTVLNKYPQHPEPDLLVFHSPIFRNEPQYSIKYSQKNKAYADQKYVDFPAHENWFIAAKTKAPIVVEWRDKYIEMYTTDFQQISNILSPLNIDTMPFMCSSYFRQHLALNLLLYHKQKEISSNYSLFSELPLRKSVQQQKIWTINYLVGVFPIAIMSYDWSYQYTNFTKVYLQDNYKVINSPQHPIKYFFKTINHEWNAFNYIFSKNMIKDGEQKQSITISQQNWKELCSDINNEFVIVEDSMLHKYLIAGSSIENKIAVISSEEYKKRLEFCSSKEKFFFDTWQTRWIAKIVLVLMALQFLSNMWIGLGFPLYVKLRVKEFQPQNQNEQEILKSENHKNQENCYRYSLQVRNLRNYENYQQDTLKHKPGPLTKIIVSILDYVAEKISHCFFFNRGVAILIDLIGLAIPFYISFKIEFQGYKLRYLESFETIVCCLILNYITKKLVSLDLVNQQAWYQAAYKWPQIYPNSSKSYHYRYQTFYYTFKHMISIIQIHELTKIFLYLGDQNYSRVPLMAAFIGLIGPLVYKQTLAYFVEIERLQGQKQAGVQHEKSFWIWSLFWIRNKPLIFAAALALTVFFIPTLKYWVVFSLNSYHYYLMQTVNWLVFWSAISLLILFCYIALFPNPKANPQNSKNRRSFLLKPLLLFVSILVVQWLFYFNLSYCVVSLSIIRGQNYFIFFSISLGQLFYITYGDKSLFSPKPWLSLAPDSGPSGNNCSNGSTQLKLQEQQLQNHQYYHSPQFPYVLKSTLQWGKITQLFLLWLCFNICFIGNQMLMPMDDILDVHIKTYMWNYIILLTVLIVYSLLWLIGIIQVFVLKQKSCFAKLIQICKGYSISGITQVLQQNLRYQAAQPATILFSQQESSSFRKNQHQINQSINQ